MIVTFVLNCPAVSRHGDFCYVVDNPKDWGASFAVPVAVLSYAGASLVPFKTYPSRVRDSSRGGGGGGGGGEAADDPSETGPLHVIQDSVCPDWESPFRWHWRTDTCVRSLARSRTARFLLSSLWFNGGRWARMVVLLHFLSRLVFLSINRPLLVGPFVRR
jgi:hypothetical protein